MTGLEHGLLQLVMTALRETSPQSAPAFQADKDLPRLNYHLRDGLAALGIGPEPQPTPGGPAVLQIPPPPAQMSLPEQDAWLQGWYAGYSLAWKSPTIELTDTES